MSGQPPRHGGAGGWRNPPPPHQPPYLGFQNSNFFPHPFFPNPNFPIQNPNFVNFPIQQNPNPNFHFHQPQFQQPQFQQPYQRGNSGVAVEQDKGNNGVAGRVNGSVVNVVKHDKGNNKADIERVNKAVIKARKELIELGKNVSAWKVSQAALVILSADTWDSLGFKVQEVPSLQNLIVTEGKINAFIHCFVGVQGITTLYDLGVAICKNEGVEQFEDLELGPLVKHPLIIHYFSINLDVSEVFRIRSQEIMSFLSEFMDADESGQVNVDEFLNFITEKKSAGTRENLCVRVQSLRMYITFIQEARQFETSTVNKYIRMVKKKSSKNIRNRPLLSAEKKQLDEHFNAMRERVKSFSSAKDFCGKHTRFSSSSEYESSDDDQDESAAQSPAGNIKSSDMPTTCPYPSASEEMIRLGLKAEDGAGLLTASGGDRYSKDIRHPKSKRKHDDVQSSIALPKKAPKRDVVTHLKTKGSELPLTWNEESDGSNDFSHSDDLIKSFVNTWKEACRTNNVDEVFQRMLQFYKARKKNKVTKLFSSYPYCGLLQVAVASIKRGMWDSLYDKFQTFQHCGVTNRGAENCADSICIDVESPERDATNLPEKACESGITVEDIVGKIITYFEGDDNTLSTASSYHEKFFFLLNKFHTLESWLTTQFAVKKFESLGYGDIWHFLEKSMHLFIHTLPRCLTDEMHEKPPLEPPSMLDYQFDLLLSQASQCLWENEKVDKQRISELLMRQFPLICLNVAGSDLMIDIENFMNAKKGNMASKSVIFSETLRKGSAMDKHKEYISKETGMEEDVGHGDWILMSKDAMKVLVNAPMLIDLKLWSHWDMVFAPSLGSLVDWLLIDFKPEELLCLVTTCGKVVRVDHSVTIESFENVLLQGNPFDTAVKLVSLLVLYGGEKNVPNSLLKCHARKAFEVLIKNYEEMKSHDIQDSLKHATSLCRQLVHCETTSTMNWKLLRRDRVGKIAPLASRFILDCLGYLPVEFCHFAADILLAGVQPFVKDAPLAILAECERIEQRLMLHRVGMSLGIVEWVEDKHKLSACSATNLLMSSGSSCLKVAELDFSKDSIFMEEVSTKYPSSGNEISLSQDPAWKNENQDTSCSAGIISHVPLDNSDEGAKQHSYELESSAARVIESIQQEEFGLQPDLPLVGNAILNKQHARLGRALHCLSQELYSQDSHFILELVQNADDNIYTEDVEPTLTFILQDKGIIVLNNERGFSADNIRALCDVGNSTKKGRNAGYIGKKGIGFKSVFRVTDAPEIHSNGFHIKFDITNGQIGFVLPTVVPPCDIDFYSRLASSGSDCNFWNTCIVLPFRSNLLERSGEENIMSMFADLHPSLLLFLHRLHCIKFRNMVSDSIVVMRKEVVGSGIIKISFGEEKLTCFVVSQKLQADTIRPDTPTTEISIAFTLQETLDGSYNPHLDQQPVFAFLPLRKYGLKFILQGDFVLPSSREEVDGDSPWNQWLLSEFPSLFVSAARSFCDLPCFKDNPAKAVTAYMSFVPLVGEVHGFFSSLPRMILSRLRTSNCLIIESMANEWVPPCKVLRNWTQEARKLLPDNLLRKHIGVGFLHKDIVLPDLLARALGIEEYGLKVLLQVITSLCSSDDGLKSMGSEWLCGWLNAVYTMLSNGNNSADFGIESHLMKDLKNIPFIPLSDGKYGSPNEGTIWLHIDSMGTATNDEYALETFSILYSTLRTVSPTLLSAAATLGTSCSESSILDNVTRMLYRVGVQRLSAHQIVKMHILPFICRDQNGQGHRETMTEYLAFLMFHLQSSCPDCRAERDQIIREVRDNAFILTNHGCKCPVKFPIHFGKEFENPVDMGKLLHALDFEWHEIEDIYLKHPINKLLSEGVLKWRQFFQEIGITDFVRVLQVEKNISDICSVHMNAAWDKDVISRGSIAKDWVSEELVDLLSRLSSTRDKEKSKYLLEVLDSLWDANFSDKVTGIYFTPTGEKKSFDSSFSRILRNIQWLASSMDNELHCPRELFHDCEPVRSIFGDNARYSIPKVRSEKLLTALGLKTQVTADDALAILKIWRAKVPLSASLSQMSKFYTFIWSRMNTSERKLVEELCNGPFVFVPCKLVASHEDVVPGVFLSSKEVFWHDTTGSIDLVKMVCPEFDPHSAQHPFTKMLCSAYPALHDFFVKECGVDELPHFHGYLQILLQLSAAALPSQGAKNVFHIFLKWVDELNLGSLRSEDISFLKEGLLTKDYLVLPTVEDKWVSLHPSFGLVCWCDDDKLRKEFQYFDNIKFLYFGQLNDDEKEILRTKVSVFMDKLNIPSISKLVTREAIFDGPTDSSFVMSMINWALPYAQRYIYNIHPDKYLQLRQSGFQNLRCLQIVVVEKLFYRNVIRSSRIASKKQFECSCLLEGDILYATYESDSHSIFMEISRLLSSGTPNLHLANFLHMITTMAESGSNEEQTEFFILNSQKMPKLPVGESVWSLTNVPLSTYVETGLMNTSITIDEKNSMTIKRRPGISSSWPPTDWKTAPGFHQPSAFAARIRAASFIESKKVTVTVEESVMETCKPAPTDMTCVENMDNDPASAAVVLGSQDADHACHVLVPGTMNEASGSPHPMTEPHGLNCNPSGVTERDQLYVGTNGSDAQKETGRLGEYFAFKYFVEKFGEPFVKWVNEANESGLPYDLVVGDDEYIEIKATRSATKNWFHITSREWQFAIEKGESFSIAHVVLSPNNTAIVTVYKNPFRLYQLGKLQLALLISKV
ncbi:protein NO VEIN isoform X1 [Capsicum chacoense]